MVCPICKGKTKVIDSRSDENSVQRLRICVKCEHKFYTSELETDSRKAFNRALSYIKYNF